MTKVNLFSLLPNAKGDSASTHGGRTQFADAAARAKVSNLSQSILGQSKLSQSVRQSDFGKTLANVQADKTAKADKTVKLSRSSFERDLKETSKDVKEAEHKQTSSSRAETAKKSMQDTAKTHEKSDKKYRESEVRSADRTEEVQQDDGEPRAQQGSAQVLDMDGTSLAADSSPEGMRADIQSILSEPDAEDVADDTIANALYQTVAMSNQHQSALEIAAVDDSADTLEAATANLQVAADGEVNAPLATAPEEIRVLSLESLLPQNQSSTGRDLLATLAANNAQLAKYLGNAEESLPVADPLQVTAETNETSMQTDMGETVLSVDARGGESKIVVMGRVEDILGQSSYRVERPVDMQDANPVQVAAAATQQAGSLSRDARLAGAQDAGALETVSQALGNTPVALSLEGQEEGALANSSDESPDGGVGTGTAQGAPDGEAEKSVFSLKGEQAAVTTPTGETQASSMRAEQTAMHTLGVQTSSTTGATQQAGPLAGAERPAGTDYNIPRQIVEQARLIQRGQDTAMIIKLNPEYLGELTVRVSTTANGSVNASFHSDNALVRGIIENSMAQLRQELQAQGLKVDNVGVYAGLADGQMPQSQDQQGLYQGQQTVDAGHGGEHGAAESDYVDGGEIDSTLSVAHTPTGVNVSDDGVDYRI